MQEIWLNGEKAAEQEVAALEWHQRATYYGDAVWESVRIHQHRPLWLMLHLERLKKGAKTLGYQVSKAQWSEIENWLHQCPHAQARARLMLARKPGGLYAPQSDKVHWMGTFAPLTESAYAFNKKGLNIGIYRECTKERNALSGLKTANALLYVLAARKAAEQSWDEALILNSDGRVVEGASSNLFLWKNDALLSPPLSEGSLDGVMRKVILKLAQSNGIAVSETSLSIADLETADEIWLSNAIAGIRWVGALHASRYYAKQAKKMHALLCENLSVE